MDELADPPNENEFFVTINPDCGKSQFEILDLLQDAINNEVLGGVSEGKFKIEATSFSQVVKDADAVKPEEFNALGFVLIDKKAGSFKMEVESIKAERAAK